MGKRDKTKIFFKKAVSSETAFFYSKNFLTTIFITETLFYLLYFLQSYRFLHAGFVSLNENAILVKFIIN